MGGRDVQPTLEQILQSSGAFSSGRFIHQRARVGPRPWSRTASSSASGASSWQPGHPVAARDSPRRMNLAVVPSATSSHRARTPGRPVGAKLGHATSRAQPHSAHFTACRATLFYAPISLDLTRSRQVAPPSRSTPTLNSRSVSSWGTVTVIAALGLDGVRAPLAFPGSTDTAAFQTYVEQVLVPELHGGGVAVFA